MSGSELKAGDIVVLKSGGPKMTIDRGDLDGQVWVCWFDGPILRHECFPPATLEIYSSGAVAPSAELNALIGSPPS
jgi:uncharacterized protein YodC (DUF2158 family)